MRGNVCWVEDSGLTSCGRTEAPSFTALDREVTCAACRAVFKAAERKAKEERRG